MEIYPEAQSDSRTVIPRYYTRLIIDNMTRGIIQAKREVARDTRHAVAGDPDFEDDQILGKLSLSSPSSLLTHRTLQCTFHDHA